MSPQSKAFPMEKVGMIIVDTVPNLVGYTGNRSLSVQSGENVGKGAVYMIPS